MNEVAATAVPNVVSLAMPTAESEPYFSTTGLLARNLSYSLVAAGAAALVVVSAAALVAAAFLVV